FGHVALGSSPNVCIGSLRIALFRDRNRYPGRPLERLLAVDEYFSLVAVLQADGNIHCRDHVTVRADDLLAVADDRQTGGLQAVRPVFDRGEADVRPKFNWRANLKSPHGLV